MRGVAAFGGVAAFAGVYMLTTRRRRGVWIDDGDEGCNLNPNYISPSAVGPNDALQLLCTSTLGSIETCNTCNECIDTTCIYAIPGCDEFLATVYSTCSEAYEVANWAMIIGAILLAGLGMCCICWFCGCGACLGCGAVVGDKNSLKKRRERREDMEGDNGHNLGDLMFEGTYTENNETLPTRSNINVAKDGTFRGQNIDDDGFADMDGVITWPHHSQQGEIAWVETRPGVEIEFEGTIAFDYSKEIQIDANYTSSFKNTKGHTNVRTRGGSQHAGYGGGGYYSDGLPQGY